MTSMMSSHTEGTEAKLPADPNAECRDGRSESRSVAQSHAGSASGQGSQKLLLVGPLPPPMSGTHVTFEILCEEAEQLIGPANIEVIDTSQKRLKKVTRIASFGNFKQACAIVRQFRSRIADADVVLLFGSNGFLLSMAPVLLWLAKRAGKPMYMRAFGGSLDRFAERQNPILRSVMNWTLKNIAGLSVQTELLHRHFDKLLPGKVQVAPGFRRIPETSSPSEGSPTSDDRKPLRVVFVGIVREDKGVFVLLEALQRLAEDGVEIECDIYGPLWPKSEEEFVQKETQLDVANYRGVLDPNDVVPTIQQYDALVLPTYYQGEGHPGVIVESMMAGIAAVTTDYRSIPELVQDGVNGLIVPPGESEALAEALRRLCDDRELLREMSERNWQQRQQYDAKRVVPMILEQMGAVLHQASARPDTGTEVSR